MPDELRAAVIAWTAARLRYDAYLAGQDVVVSSLPLALEEIAARTKLLEVGKRLLEDGE